MTPIQRIPFLVTVSPLVTAYGPRGLELQRKLGRIIPNELVQKSQTGKDLIKLVNKELRDFNLGVPMKAMFVDGVDGNPIEAEYAEQAVMVIIIDDGTDTIHPTRH